MDSLTYLQVARELAAGQGIVVPDFDLSGAAFSPMTMWPPLYPALLSALCIGAECTTAGILEKSVYLNIILLIVSGAIFYLLVSDLVSKWFAILAALSFIFLPALQIPFMYLWSETLFIPLVLLSFYCLRIHLREHGPRGALIAAVVLVALATYTRYVGVSFAFSLLASVFMFGSGSLFSRFRSVIFLGVGYTLLIIPLLIRNVMNTGHLSGGERGTPEFRMQEDASSLWQLFSQEMFSANALFMSAWLILLGALFFVSLYRRKGPQASDILNTRKMDYVMPWLWCAIYLVFLLISRSVQRVDIDTRMLCVILPFFLLGIFGLTRRYTHSMHISVAYSPAIIVVAIAGWSGFNCHQTLLENLRREHSAGYVNHMRYYSITEPRFDMFRELEKRFKLDDGDVVLTDIPRPQIAKYFFEQATVKSVVAEGEDLDFDRLAPFEQRRGLLILHRQDLQQRFTSFYAQNSNPTYAAYMSEQGAPLLVMELPLQRH